MSPQYHSASFSRLLVSVMADGAIMDLTGFAGRTGNRHKHTQKSQLTAFHTKVMDLDDLKNKRTYLEEGGLAE